MNSKKQEKSGFGEEILRPSVFGGILGIALIILIVSLMALIMSFGIIPIKAAPLMSSVSTALGGFLGGKFAAKKSGKNGIVVGALTGAILFVIFSIFSLIVFKSAPSAATLIRAIIFITSSAVGGIIGVGSSDKRKII